MAPDPHDGTGYAPPPPVVGPETYESATARVANTVLSRKIQKPWLYALIGAFILLQGLFFGTAWLFARGVGIWGINVPVSWGWAIVNLVWWIGIGHAGTLISAVLLLFKQEWRMAIARFAEAMTLFAVCCAGLFPILHLGRPWVAFWLAPYPNSMGMWPNFRSPLVWDLFAISTYLTISLLFWFVGLIPDFATLRDRAVHVRAKYIYGILAMGWRGSARHWHRYEVAALLLAGLATPLVVSVHTIVSFDFAVGILPGWHATIFPPYFVAGAVYSGFAMVLTLIVPVRHAWKLESLVTERHLQNMAKIMLVTGMIVAYGYAMEAFMAFYSGNLYEWFMFKNRVFGPTGWSYWLLLLCNITIPQALWSKRVRSNPWALFGVSMFINVGMWLERYVIIVTSLTRDFLPSSWASYSSTVWDWMLYIGTIGLFLFAMILFIRVLPLISMFEVRTLLPSPKSPSAPHDGGEP